MGTPKPATISSPPQSRDESLVASCSLAVRSSSEAGCWAEPRKVRQGKEDCKSKGVREMPFVLKQMLLDTNGHMQPASRKGLRPPFADQLSLQHHLEEAQSWYTHTLSWLGIQHMPTTYSFTPPYPMSMKHAAAAGAAKGQTVCQCARASVV